MVRIYNRRTKNNHDQSKILIRMTFWFDHLCSFSFLCSPLKVFRLYGHMSGNHLLTGHSKHSPHKISLLNIHILWRSSYWLLPRRERRGKKPVNVSAQLHHIAFLARLKLFTLVCEDDVLSSSCSQHMLECWACFKLHCISVKKCWYPGWQKQICSYTAVTGLDL